MFFSFQNDHFSYMDEKKTARILVIKAILFQGWEGFLLVNGFHLTILSPNINLIINQNEKELDCLKENSRKSAEIGIKV